MANINGKSRASFRWMLSCATIGIAVTVSPCFAQGDRDAPQEPQRLQEVHVSSDPATASTPRSVSTFISAAWSSYQNVHPT
jgi:hypothetical protein